jgi:Papain family cysteine protease
VTNPQSSTPVVDWRPTLSPIQDQAQRRTCLAFAVTAAHEASRSGASAPDDLSEEGLFWGCKRIDGNWSGGTSFTSAGVAIGRWGQPLEATWPYDVTRREGVAYSPPTRAGGMDWYRSGLRRVAVGLGDVRTYLDRGIAVVLGLTLVDTFFQPDPQGRVNDPPAGAPTRGRHAVLAVGYQPTEILIRNSWGDTWALGGYAWISDTYIQRYAAEAWVIDASVGPSGVTLAQTAGERQEATYGSR